MTDKPGYSFVDATFAFFQAVGRRPGAAAWITLWHLILYTAVTGLVLALVAPFIMLALTLAAQGGEPDPAQLLRAASGLVGAYALSVLGYLVSALLVQGAWLRFLARNEVAKVIPLRLGADELRLLVVNLAFFAFNAVGWTAVFIVFALINAGVVAAVSSGEAGVAAAITGGLINVLLGLAVGVIALIVMIRFAAAPALSMRLKGIKLFESFSATRGIAAWMFVSYLVLIALYFVGYAVVATVQNIVILLAAADLIAMVPALENTDDPQLVLQLLGEALLQPSVAIAFLIAILFQIALQIMFEGSWHGVGVYVARREAGDFPSDAIETPAGSVGAAPDEG